MSRKQRKNKELKEMNKSVQDLKVDVEAIEKTNGEFWKWKM